MSSEPRHTPGEIVEKSGLYPVVDQAGNEQGYEVTVVQGEPFPPTPEKGWGFGTPRLAKTTNSEEETVAKQSIHTLSTQRPVFAGDSALIPSGALPNNRPILKQSRKVVSRDHLPLHRPVFQSTLSIARMDGNRPILHINSHFSQSEWLPNHRPILSEVNPSQNLMGYID